MGLMNAIGLQPRHPAPSVTSQGTQTPIIQLQNAETQTERDLSEPSVSPPAPNVPPEPPSTSGAAAGQPEASQGGGQSEASAEGNTSTAGSGESAEFGSGEDALARIRRLIAEGGMTAVVQREQSTTMASMGGFGNNIIVSHRIHRGSQTGSGAPRLPADPPMTTPSTSGALPITQPQTCAPPQASNASEPLTPVWPPQVLPPQMLPAPPPPALSVPVDMDDVFEGGRTDEESLPGPSSSLLLSSPSSSSSSRSPHPGSGVGPPDGYPGDPYSR